MTVEHVTARAADPEAVRLAGINLSDDEVRATLAPFVLELYPPGDARFRKRHAKLMAKWRLKRLKRAVLGALAGLKRTQAYVEQSYETTFAQRPWPETLPPVTPETKPTLADWGDEALLVRRYGLGRAHLLLMARTIAALQPKNVLEVGCGTGINLFVLAAQLPDVQWTGIELTQTGVAQANQVIGAPELPKLLADYCPVPVADRAAHRRIVVQRGNAMKLDFPDKHFDMVITRQALEQMDMIREPVLKEIARVAKRHVVLTEPFADFNRDPLRSTYVAAKDYFSLPVAGLESFGITPLRATNAFPQNVCLGIGMVVGRLGGA